jgi:hypothetical protein
VIRTSYTQLLSQVFLQWKKTNNGVTCAGGGDGIAVPAEKAKVLKVI